MNTRHLLHAKTVLAISITILCLGTDMKSAQRRDSLAERNTPEMVVQLGHSKPVISVAFSPDGRMVLTGSQDGIVRLWDIESGYELRQFVGHWGGVDSVAFSPYGNQAVTGGYLDMIRLWDVASGRQVRRFAWNSKDIHAAVFLPELNLVLAGDTKGIAYLWSLTYGVEIQRFVGHSSFIISVAISANRTMAITGSVDKTARLWDVISGKELQRLIGHTNYVEAVAFSPDGQRVLTGSSDNTARLWEVSSGKQLQTFIGHSHAVKSVAFSPDGSKVLTGSYDDTARLWDAKTGKELLRFTGHSQYIESVAFSPDGKTVLTGSWDNTARLWDAATGKEIRRFAGNSGPINSVAFSSDGKMFLTGGHNGVHLWDATSGQEMRSLVGYSRDVEAAVISTNNNIVLAGCWDSTARLWDVASGKEIKQFIGHAGGISSVALSPDGSKALTGGRDSTVRLWDIDTGNQLLQFSGHSRDVTSVAFSPDGSKVLTGSYDDTARLWDAKTGKELLRFTGHDRSVLAGVFSPDGKIVLTKGWDYKARLWNSNNGEELGSTSSSTFYGHGAAFSLDGKMALLADDGGRAKLFDVTSKTVLHYFVGHSDEITSVAFSPDGRMAITGGKDGTTRLWDVKTGKQLESVISFDDGNWAVVTPDGRFDANNLEELKGLHWVVSDEPYRGLPLEIFMRDYYEPRLFTRILAGEPMRPLPNLSNINRVQPIVQITEITPHSNSPDTLDVTLKVASATTKIFRDGKKIVLESEVFDLRLFRDGQLIGYAPEQSGPVKLESGKATITFKDIKLPRRADLKQVEFSAYAFNVDRVKSTTDRKIYMLPRPLPAVKGRAYVITVGVNAYESRAFDLRFAANDARRLQTVLTEKLKATGEYDEVVPVALLSDYELKGDQRILTAQQATKKNVKAVLDLLAGKQVNRAQAAGILNANKIRPARPEDLVIISFASHGYADEQGRFYFVTYDTGAGAKREVTPALLEKSISSDELSLWLRDVDAGEMVMIVDACQSAAAVEGEGFKPGPMGSRGLGQLAYDKGMRILAATQADNVALEHELIKQGLLTYALVHDGIEMGRADFKPEDKTITLAEWLSYTEKRVPELFEEIKRGRVRKTQPVTGDSTKIIIFPQTGSGSNASAARLMIQGKTIGLSVKPTLAEEQIQRPALFDFSRNKRDALLMRR